MSGTRRIYTREFKLAAIKQVESGKAVGLVARQLELDQKMIHRWLREFKKEPKEAFRGQGNKREESRVAELERKIGQMAMENDFLKKVLAALEEQQAEELGGGFSTGRSKKKRRR